METKAKTKSIFLKMLVALIIVATLIAGIFMAMPKATQVHAAEAGSSATLAGNTRVSEKGSQETSWLHNLANPITKTNIASILITTDSSAIQGFTQGVDDGGSAINIAEDGSTPIYYYYKATGVQVDTDEDGATDSDSYDVVIYSDVETIYAPVDCFRLFSELSNCKTITFENFDTSSVTDMDDMFSYCSLLTTLDFSDNFNINNVTDMDSMFYNCSSLSSLNLSSFGTNQVTDMSLMFAECKLLTTLDFGDNFDTKNVTNMNSMFGDCSSLTSLNLSGFNTSLVTDMNCMFAGCALTELDLSSFSFQSITDASGVEMMLGMTHAQVAQMIGLEDMGISIEDYVNATYDEKIAMLTGLGASEIDAAMFVAMGEPIPKIIAPADLNGLSIALPGEYEYIEGDTQTTSVLVAGATHTLPGYVEPEKPTLPESGVTMLDLVILTMLTLTISGVSLMLLKRKKFN